MSRLTIATIVAVLASGCATAVRSSSADTIRVLIYNIHAGKDAKGIDNLERVANIIRDTRADIVLLQEVDKRTARSGNVDQIATLATLTGFHGAFGKTLDYQGGDYGIAVLSRWPIHHDTLIKLPVEPPQARSGGIYEPRGALRAVIQSPGGTLRILNTHIDASREDFYRRQEAATLVRTGAAMRSEGGTALIGGDLNSEPESGVMGMFASAGWRDLWKSCGVTDGNSYPADKPIKRIDYLLTAGEAKCTRAEVLVTEASDHRPVLFEIMRR
ncbi:MAG TPA: endonuclease/exonuclease/phosphatase family protein [Gemmatimonadaceae bacterium]|nr:endonuclease/exonuclease/phosphatase family protein [Gemmatimonadaceae bacterium]